MGFPSRAGVLPHERQCLALPSTFLGEVDRLEVKMVRYSGHAEQLKALFTQIPQADRATYFSRVLPSEGPDLVVMRVEGIKDGKRQVFELEDRYDPATQLTAMMRTTGYPAAILAQLASQHQLPSGAVIQERDIPVGPIIDGLRARGHYPRGGCHRHVPGETVIV